MKYKTPSSSVEHGEASAGGWSREASLKKSSLNHVLKCKKEAGLGKS